MVSVEQRIIVVGLVQNRQGKLLLCKMPPNRGVFPNQWGLPGGGLEAGETIEEGLGRELREELGIEIEDIKPVFFKDGQYEKAFPDGSKRKIYMIFLIFQCWAQSEEIKLNSEFAEYCWVSQEETSGLDLNIETIDTLNQVFQEDIVKIWSAIDAT